MTLMRETPRSIAIYFFISGALSLLSGIQELSQILAISKQPEGLSLIGELYRVVEYLLIGAAIFIIVIGTRFKQTVLATPARTPVVLAVVLVLKVAQALLLLTPQAVGGVLISGPLLTYLFFQTRRLTAELRSSSQ